jgi:uncharacterized membrane protein
MPTFSVPTSDIIGLVWFATVWIGYTIYTDDGKPRQYSLRAAMHKNRYRWMTQVLTRDNRTSDMLILQQLGQGSSFFISATLLILVGLFTALGASEDALVTLHQIPYAGKTSLSQWQLRVLVLLIVFIHAFFKFTWGVRQFNYCAVLVGAAPAPGTRDDEWVQHTAWISTLASKDFNQGIRAYYFGLAIPMWFINAWVFMGATVLVVAVLYWREYHSGALRSLELPLPSGMTVTDRPPRS